MNARIHPLPFNAQGLRGLSERLILSHHQNHYGGAVQRLGAIRAGAYVDAFMDNIAWAGVHQRYQAAVAQRVRPSLSRPMGSRTPAFWTCAGLGSLYRHRP